MRQTRCGRYIRHSSLVLNRVHLLLLVVSKRCMYQTLFSRLAYTHQDRAHAIELIP